MHRTPSLVCLVVLALGLTACAAQKLSPTQPPTGDRPTFTSTVLSVSDGDTLTVLANNKSERVRLINIDCPESDQPFGRQATQLTTQLALEKAVTVTDLWRAAKGIGADGHARQRETRFQQHWWDVRPWTKTGGANQMVYQDAFFEVTFKNVRAARDIGRPGCRTH